MIHGTPMSSTRVRCTYGLLQPSPLLPCSLDIMASRNSSGKSKYDYQKQFVWCTCSECVVNFGSKGQQIKQYTRQKHLEKDELSAIRNKGKRPALPIVPFSETATYKKTRLDNPESSTQAMQRVSEVIDNIGGPSGNRRPDSMPLDAVDLEAEQHPSHPTTQIPPPRETSFDDIYLDHPVDIAHQDDHFDILTDPEIRLETPGDVSFATDRPISSEAPPAVHPQPIRRDSSSTPVEPILEPPTPPTEVFQDSCGIWFWRIILVLAAWLHLHYHVPHRACILMLKVLRVIFVCLGQINHDNQVPVTLTTTFRRLSFNDEFKIYPTCPQCHHIYPVDSPVSLQCENCSIPLFKFWQGTGDDDTSIPSGMRNRPVLQCPLQPISEQLPRILNRYNVEILCDEWRSRQTKPGCKTHIMDGEIWKTLKGHDGKPFFDNAVDRANPDELWIGITLGFDG